MTKPLRALSRRARCRLALCSVLVLCSVLWSRAAAAGPRLVVLEGTEAAQLHQALVVSLAPWSFEVVDWPRDAAGVDGAAVASRAQARYVVWYDASAGELVVLDAELAHTERRPLEALPTEEADASAVALAIKMMLRLPPAPAGPGAASAPTRWQVVPLLRVGVRQALDGDSAQQLRAQAGLEVGWPRLRGLRLGVLASFGDSSAVDQGGFKGTWSEWSAMLSASKGLKLGRWRVMAQVAAGLSRSSLDVQQGKTVRSEQASHATGAMVLGAGLPLGAFTFGGAVAAEVRGAASYARDNGQPLWAESGLWTVALATLEVAL